MNIVVIYLVLMCVVVGVAMAAYHFQQKRQEKSALLRRQAMGRRVASWPVQTTVPVPSSPAPTPTVEASSKGPVPDFFQQARNSPFDALACLRSGDIDGARQALQKIAYLVHADKQTNPDQVRQFTKLMCMFAEIDPLFWRCLNAVKPVVQQSPGVRQTLLYEHMPVDVETARYVLYFAHETGHLVRRKKGNSYEVFLPGQSMPPVQAKRKKT